MLISICRIAWNATEANLDESLKNVSANKTNNIKVSNEIRAQAKKTHDKSKLKTIFSSPVWFSGYRSRLVVNYL